MGHEGDGYTYCNWRTRYNHQRMGTRSGGLGNKRTSGDHSNSNIVEISQNTEKSPGDLRRFAVTQTLVWKPTNKNMEHESDVYTNCNLFSWYSHRRINKGTGGLENKRKSGDHPNNCIIEIDQNTEKSPGDSRSLAVTQTSVKTISNANVKNSSSLNNNCEKEKKITWTLLGNWKNRGT